MSWRLEVVGGGNARNQGYKAGLAGLLAIALPLLLTGLGSVPLLDPDEAKHAQIAREMLATGRWLEPVLYGQPYHHKPSFLYLLIGLCYRVFGVGELAARMVPATAAAITVVALYRVGARRHTQEGLLAALLLLGSPLFFAVARFTNFDGLLTAVLFGAVVCAASWIEAPTTQKGRLAFLHCCLLTGLGVLVKGPVASVLLIVPLAAVGLSALRVTGRATLVAGTLLLAAVVACWAVPAYRFHPDYLHDFLWVHNVQRYWVDADLFHPEPWWFFAPVLLATLLPASVLLPKSVIAAWRRSPADRLFVAYAVWVFVFFSFSNGKLATYVLPAYPVLALLVARWLSERPRAARSRVLAVVAAVYLFSPLVAYVVVRHEAPGFEIMSLALLSLTVAGCVVLVGPRWGVFPSERGTVTLLTAGMLATFLVCLVRFAGEVGRLTSDRDLVETIRASAAAAPDRVVVHNVRPFSFLFYSQWPLVYKVGEQEYRAALTGPGRVILLTKDSRLGTMPQPGPPFELREIARNHRHVVYERFVAAAREDR